jgi:hypothetical protein
MKYNRGFTLIEILVASFVTMATMAATTSALIDFLRNRQHAQNWADMIISSESIINYLTSEIHWANETIFSDPTFIAKYPHADGTTTIRNYSLDPVQGNLIRDEKIDLTPISNDRINNPNIKITKFDMKEFNGSGVNKLWRITLEMEHTDRFAGSTSKYEHTTTISSRLNQIGGP